MTRIFDAVWSKCVNFFQDADGFQLLSQSWAVRSCSLLNLAWKWTADITVKSCWSNRRCQSCVSLQATCLCSSKTVHLHTGHVRLSSSCSSRHRTSSRQICGHLEQSWSEPSQLQNLRFDAGACLQDSCWRRQSAEISVSSTPGQVCLRTSSATQLTTMTSATLNVCKGQGSLLWASSALKPAVLRAIHDVQKSR